MGKKAQRPHKGRPVGSKKAAKPKTKAKAELEPKLEVEPKLEPKAELELQGMIEPEAAPPITKKILYRCIAENSATVKSCEFGRVFGAGQIVDLDESLRDGSKLREHVKQNCFAPIGAGGE